MKRFNLVAGSFEFVQDGTDLEKFHAPGGRMVNEKWVTMKAFQEGWGPVSRRPSMASSGRWEDETTVRWKQLTESVGDKPKAHTEA
jgi:hypothetical protein